MTPVRVIGVGSPHGSDTAGWRAVEAMQHDGLTTRFPDGTVSLENCPAPVQLYRLVEGCRLAILVDAVASDAPQPLDIEPVLLRREPARYSAHAIGVADMLELLDSLAKPPPRVVLFGLPVAEAAQEQHVLQARVQALLPALSREVEQVIDCYLGGAC